MPKRPINHVTIARDLRVSEALRSSQPPEAPEELLVWLETVFPARCYTSTDGETLEQHLLYAGKVDLIDLLRSANEARKMGEEIDDADLDMEDLP